MNKPFDGAISSYFNDDAPADIRQAVTSAGAKPILGGDYPYDTRLNRKTYEASLYALQVELVKLQAWVKSSGARIAVVFEGRDAAGKGGTIKRFRSYLNPRSARVVALSKPSEKERGEWYFQRYVSRLPTAGEMVFFDRSWYNRGVIEQVFGFCTDEQRHLFFDQVCPFEKMLADDGVQLFKIWLNVGRAEQLRRFLARESDPLKQWKLSSIDVKGLPKWPDYSRAIRENFERSHTDVCPWTVIRADDKRRSRLAAIQSILCKIDYDLKNTDTAINPDPAICGGPELWHD